MAIGHAVGGAILPAIDRLVEARYAPAMDAVERLKGQYSHLEPPALADLLIARYRKELTAVGAAAGGASAIPGVGTAAGIAASGADVSWTMTRLGELIISIGGAYGHSADDIEERRAWVLAVLGIASGAAGGLSGVAAQVGNKGGVKIVKSIPMSQIVRINRALGGRIIVKFGTKQGAVRLGRLIPFGVGAGIGAGGNLLLVSSVGRSAKNFFDEGLSQADPGVSA